MIAYHGTATAHLPSIEQRGIVPGAGEGADMWAAKKRGNTLFIERNSDRPRAYVATDKLAAQQFAAYTADLTSSEPVVLAVKIDPRSFKRDTHSADGMGALWTASPIPPSAILDIETVPAELAHSMATRRGAFDGDYASLLERLTAMLEQR